MSHDSEDKEQEKKAAALAGQHDDLDTGADNDFMAMMYSLLEVLGLGHLFKGNPDRQKELEDAIKPENLVADQVFISAVTDMVDQAQLTAAQARDVVNMPAHTEAALRATVNRAFEKSTETGEAAGIGYEWGARDGSAIDCSGFVQKSLEYASATVSGNHTRNIFNFNAATYSGAQIDNALHAGGSLLTNKQVTLDNLKPGMIIGMDTGDKGWDAGRKRGIDHVVLVYKDSETGEMMIGQSSSSGGGVNGVSARSWLNKWQNEVDAGQASLYAVDTIPLVKEQFQPTPDNAHDIAVADKGTDYEKSQEQDLQQSAFKPQTLTT